MNFFIKTFGCKVNQFESEYFINSLIENNYSLTNLEEADIVIINSCAVTKEAERQLYQFIRKIKRNFPDKKIILTGCVVENNFNKIKNNKIVDAAASNYYKNKLPDLICSSLNFFKYQDIFSEQNFRELNFTDLYSHTRKFFKIQDGCNNYCSYCIIPYTRGKPRSLPLEKVLEHTLKFTKKYREVVLTGINIGIYGKDLGLKNGLFMLLKNIDEKLRREKVENFRIRITSLKPDEINSDLIMLFKDSQYLCPHFHLSIQNLNNKVLNLMNRKYSYLTIENTINTIKNILPFAGVGCDLITGFPGENREEFEDNINKIKELDINFFHIFPFSKREGTKAYKFQENINKKIKKERVKLLQNIAEKKSEEFIKKNIHKIFKVIFEKKENGYLQGYSENYIKIFIKNEKNFNLKNKIVNVKGVSLKEKFYILGRLV